MKFVLTSYYESVETKKKMDELLPKQKTSEFIRKQTEKGIKHYEKRTNNRRPN